MINMKISLIVAMDKQRLIGRQNQLPWRLPADLKYFKNVTLGKPVLMGRKTYESLGKPLPGRQNIIITHNTNFIAEGCEIAHSLEAAFDLCKDADEIMVIGGAQLYQAALPYAQRLYITWVHGDFKGDTFFPAWSPDEWNEISRESHDIDDKNLFPYTFVILERLTKE